MRRTLAAVALVVIVAATARGQEPTGTTTGGPLTVAGVPLYGIADNGDLSWYFHQGAHNGSAAWANGGNGVRVGTGWNEGLKVFKGNPRGNDGVVYRVNSRGELLWYRHNGWNVGSANWAGAQQVGTGWQGRHAFAAGDGVLYLVNNSGDLFWYRHRGYGNGRAEWANGGNGAKVGNGWGDMRMVFATGQGVIYAVRRNGDLYWYRHTGHTNGTAQWANGGTGVKVGSGWNGVASAFSGGNGVIYALKPDGNLYWYNHSGWVNGVATWTNANGSRIGTGWGGFVRIF
jgi:hypothetical protein